MPFGAWRRGTAVLSGNGDYDGDGKWENHFRVGSEPHLLAVAACASNDESLYPKIILSFSEVVDVPDQETVDAFIAPLSSPEEWVLDPRNPRTFSALPGSDDYFAFQRNVATAMDDARGVIAGIATEFTERFGREKVAAIELTGNPDAERAIVAIGVIADSARELLEDDDDLLVVRVHTYRPFPADEIAAALSRASVVTVIDRAAAFGSFGPLGADVRALGIAATNVVCGLGGAEVTPDTLRWAMDQTSSSVLYVPEGV